MSQEAAKAKKEAEAKAKKEAEAKAQAAFDAIEEQKAAEAKQMKPRPETL